MKVLITGASGVLGTAVYEAFKEHAARSGKDEVLGTAHSRATGELEKLDLMDAETVTKRIRAFKPDWVIHCAAERRPDVAEKNVDATKKLNAEIPALLARLSVGADYSYSLVYISTDYVFDGTTPPYGPSHQTNPLNFYGITKRDGELAALNALDGKPKVIALRVPVLYGPAPNNSDSAVNVLLDVVQDQSGKTYKMDHYATRYPTNVIDIARFLVRLSNLNKPLPRIMHYSGTEPFTKYEMCLVFAGLLGLAHQHIIPDAEPPKDAVSRPRDCQLDCQETEKLLELDTTGFEEWWTERLKQ